MTYPETITYLESFINYEKKSFYPYRESIKLERIKEFLKIIDNPQDSLKCIHIAGTKGKGSVCAFCAYILREAGFKVGLYTSPHLSEVRERIRILQASQCPSTPASQFPEDFEGMISQDELVSLVKGLKPRIDDYSSSCPYGPLSFFEIYTALAFTYFKEKKVDFAVLETGLGGRLDATNVVEPLVCAITPISFDHTQKLGNTLREIAMEKAGIIKSHQSPATSHQSIVVTAPQEKEAIEIIQNKCKEAGAKLYEVGKDILYKQTKDGFNVKGIFFKYPDLKIRLLGSHQLVNATVAIGAIEALRIYNIYVDIDSIRDGLHNTVWSGRCEVISRNPLVVLDGAQNVASGLALKEAIKENFSAVDGFASEGKYKRLILVLGISKDKDIKGMCQQLYDLADEVILTKANNPRATEPKVLAGYFDNKPIHITDNVKEAKERAIGIAKKDDLILVTGSLFVVGEMRELFFKSRS